ncbi:MAG TPA: hypothetical protein VFW11_00705 [Cyclobacteriaceae bacterium]|nr:hypothetical protein [Cyclobacteriaceae bacterium]
MVYFRQTVLDQIKSATNEKEIENVIDDSIERLKIKQVNGHIIQRFFLNMERNLDRAKTEEVSEKMKQNMDVAIDLFKKLQKP